jgi:LemA protein
VVTFALTVLLLVLVAVLVVFLLGYNRIRAADVRVAEALAGIDVELTRRASLIPALVHAVQTFADHELAALDRVTAANAALAAATGGPSVARRSAAERDLDDAVGRAVAAGRTDPGLASSATFVDLQRQLAATEDTLAFARQYYNDAVATLNRLRTTLPWMFVAPLAGVPEREFYQLPR